MSWLLLIILSSPIDGARRHVCNFATPICLNVSEWACEELISQSRLHAKRKKGKGKRSFWYTAASKISLSQSHHLLCECIVYRHGSCMCYGFLHRAGGTVHAHTAFSTPRHPYAVLVIKSWTHAHMSESLNQSNTIKNTLTRQSNTTT